MISCPNKNDPRWKQMVDALGENEAYYYFNLNQGFTSEVAKNTVPKELQEEISQDMWDSLSKEEQTKIINCL